MNISIKITFALLLALSATACAAPPHPVVGAHPADPSARVAPVSYRSTIAPFRSQRPVEPLSWQEQNQRHAPKPN